ncbi:MAG TPA: class I SAM-dependent methyltransferase, partial [Candidatus Aminicenantes bacterium]|nr:class I SAM-dependent methyltransferase [Candidatus Aminicenantes bacterium]
MGTDLSPLPDRLGAFRDFLLEYNRKVNVVSRQIGAPEVDQLIRESMFLARQVRSAEVVDAGSGNGLLGLTLALLDPDRQVLLVDSRGKKVDFLRAAVAHLDVANGRVQQGAIQEVLCRSVHRRGALVARGFPSLELLVTLSVRHEFAELVVITSLEKATHVTRPLAKVIPSVYNIPERQRIVVWKI